MTTLAADRLPGVLGHELRNPLASAMAGAMLCREMVDADDPRAPVLDGVLQDLDRMTALIDGWLQIARHGNAAPQEVDVDALVAAIAARHGAEVVCGCAEARVAGDRALLERALENLLENARQAGARQVRLAVQRLDGMVTVHVEDDGRGVTAAQAERIFTPGWSGRGSSGLGLYAVAMTAAAHGGDVRCVPLARGTRFTLDLPVGGRTRVSA